MFSLHFQCAQWMELSLTSSCCNYFSRSKDIFTTLCFNILLMNTANGREISWTYRAAFIFYPTGPMIKHFPVTPSHCKNLSATFLKRLIFFFTGSNWPTSTKIFKSVHKDFTERSTRQVCLQTVISPAGSTWFLWVGAALLELRSVAKSQSAMRGETHSGDQLHLHSVLTQTLPCSYIWFPHQAPSVSPLKMHLCSLSCRGETHKEDSKINFRIKFPRLKLVCWSL